MFLYNKGKRAESDKLAGETTGCQHGVLAFYSTLLTAELPILQMAMVSTRPRERLFTWPEAIERLCGEVMRVCVVSSSSKWAVTMSWKSTALEAALQRLNMGPSWNWYLKHATSILKKNKRLVHNSVIAAFSLWSWNWNKFYKPLNKISVVFFACGLWWPVDGVLAQIRLSLNELMVFFWHKNTYLRIISCFITTTHCKAKH